MELYEAIQNDPVLANELGFDAQAIENLKSSVTPEGYDWHHEFRVPVVKPHENGHEIIRALFH